MPKSIVRAEMDRQRVLLQKIKRYPVEYSRPSETLRFRVQTAFDANIKAVVSLVPYIFQTA